MIRKTPYACGMLNDMAIVGLGQLGQHLGSGALRAGYRVTPVLRQDDPERTLHSLPSGSPVLVAVGEADLTDALLSLPTAQHEDVILLQNELFPSVWEATGFPHPSVVVPWFLKKPGQPVLVGRPSALYGRFAAEMAAIHDALGLPHERVPHETALGEALASKFVFVLTINALGLVRDLTLGQWRNEDDGQLDAVFEDALHLAEAKLGCKVREQVLREDLEEALEGLSSMRALGRSAPLRVSSALADAATLHVPTPKLRAIANASARQ